MNTNTQPSSSNFVPYLLIAWQGLAIGIGMSGIFFKATPQVMGATVWGLTALTLLSCWLVSPVRAFLSSADLRVLLRIHLVRYVGIAFIYLYSIGRLPYSFGFMGGVGDCIAAVWVTILLLRGNLQRDKSLLAWNLFGLIDIGSVVFSAMREGLRDPHSMEPLRQFPLDLLPLFFVPLIISTHVLIFFFPFPKKEKPLGESPNGA